MLRATLHRTRAIRAQVRHIQTIPSTPQPMAAMGGMIVEAIQQGKDKDLKKSVLALYRSFLRASKTDTVLRDAVINDFRKNQSLKAQNVQKIDFLLRQGHKKLALVSTPGFKGYTAS